MRTKLKSATLHEGLFIKDIGDLGKMLGETGMKTSAKEVKLAYEDGILYVTSVKGTILVPVSNVKAMEASEEVV